MQNDEKTISKRTNSFNESTKGNQTWPPRVTIPIVIPKSITDFEEVKVVTITENGHNRITNH